MRYIALFDPQIPDCTLKEIRDSINKSWVLGNEKFKQQTEVQVGRRISPLPRGGDKKSKKYKS